MNKFLKFGLLAFLMSFAIQAGSECGYLFTKSDESPKLKRDGTQMKCVLEKGHEGKHKARNGSGYRKGKRGGKERTPEERVAWRQAHPNFDLGTV